MSGSPQSKKAPGVQLTKPTTPGTNICLRRPGGSYVLQHNARFHPASSRYVKPLIKSSSEAPFTCYGSPTLHHLSARYHPHQATPLHHRWRISLLWHLYHASPSISEIKPICNSLLKNHNKACLLLNLISTRPQLVYPLYLLDFLALIQINTCKYSLNYFDT